VAQHPDGEVTFPQIDPNEWIETAREAGDGYSFVSYRRRSEQSPQSERDDSRL
jgi:dihydrofolate reductase